ncbi:MAG: endonuclease [Planctomycetes bacterium]|nr:endonuclease [Planctomycetota bacterium]
MAKVNRYTRILEAIFQQYFKPGMREIRFEREELVRVAKALRVDLPKNLGDIVYSARYRGGMPQSIAATAPEGEDWVIRPAGRSRYCFALTTQSVITPSKLLIETKIPDGTPGVIEKYAFDDEQALLAKLRYNRLIDIFTGVTCYSLQNHLRTSVSGLGQVETDELYIGIDRRGVHYVFPVQAKGRRDRISIVQIEEDFALCASKFPSLLCRSIGAQFVEVGLIVLFEFVESAKGIAVAAERHYRLVPPNEVGPDELKAYRSELLRDG